VNSVLELTESMTSLIPPPPLHFFDKFRTSKDKKKFDFANIFWILIVVVGTEIIIQRYGPAFWTGVRGLVNWRRNTCSINVMGQAQERSLKHFQRLIYGSLLHDL